MVLALTLMTDHRKKLMLLTLLSFVSLC